MPAEPPPLLPFHLWLHTCTRFQHHEDQRAHRGLQTVKWWHTHPHPNQWDGGWVCHQLQVSGCLHLWGPLFNPQHLHPDKEVSPAALLPEETKEGPSVSSDFGELLPLQHREHPYQLCHSMIWQLLCVWPESTAQRITGAPLPSIEALQRKRCLQTPRGIVKDCPHPNHRLFTLLPSGRRYRSLRTRTSRFRGSFFPASVTPLNSPPNTCTLLLLFALLAGC